MRTGIITREKCQGKEYPDTEYVDIQYIRIVSLYTGPAAIYASDFSIRRANGFVITTVMATDLATTVSGS